MTEPTIHVIDDDQGVRDSLDYMLEAASMSVKTYGSADDFLAQLDSLDRGCIVTDVRMPGLNGLELIRILAKRGAPHPVIVITGHGDVAMAVEAMRAGAFDFLEKPFEDQALLGSIRLALAKEPRADQSNEEKARLCAVLDTLSPREQDVLGGVVDGKMNKVIAFELGISPRTVEVYRANMMSKTGARTLSELVRMVTLARG
ncbi:MAG: response regulator FixJ [Caulobacterales bacterium]|jgi:two-component system response regulator FixJ